MKFEDQFEWPSQLGMTPNLDDYIYTKEVNHMIDMFDRFNMLKRDGHRETNTGRTFAVVGERGSGKTTFLNALKLRLNAENSYFVLPPIEPSVFSENLNVLEAMLAVLQIELDKNLKTAKPEWNINADRLKQSILSVTESVQGMRVKRAENAKSESSRDYLKESVDFHQLTEKMTTLFREYRQTISSIQGQEGKVDRLVIMIDDLDMVGSEYIYQAWMDIQNILAKTELYIVLTYREVQVQKALLGYVIDDNKNLLDYHQTNDIELTQQVAFMLDKQILEQQKIKLFAADALLQKKITHLVQGIFKKDKDNKLGTQDQLRSWLVNMMGVENGEPVNSQEDPAEILLDSLSAKEWISWFMHVNVGFQWQPVSGYEQITDAWPQSMRDFINFFHILTRIADNRDDKKENDTTSLVEKYLLDTADKYLPIEAALLVHDYSSATIPSKNQIFYDFLYGVETQIRTLRSEPDHASVSDTKFRYLGIELHISSIDFSSHPIIIPSMNSRDSISMGDILELCWILEAQLGHNNQMALLIVILKRLFSNAIRYSLEMPDNLFSSYRLLINGLIMPFNYNYFGRSLGGLTHNKVRELSIVKPDILLNMPSNGNGSIERNRIGEDNQDVRESQGIKGNRRSDSEIERFGYRLFSELVYSPYAITSRSNRARTPHNKSEKPMLDTDIGRSMQESNISYFLDMSINEIIAEMENPKKQIFPGNRFRIDFFSWLTRPEYLNSVLKRGGLASVVEARIIGDQTNENKNTIKFSYLLRDVMDVDLFMRQRYEYSTRADRFGDGSKVETIFNKITEIIRKTRQIKINNQDFMLINANLYSSASEEQIALPEGFALNEDRELVSRILESLILGPEDSSVEKFNASVDAFERNFFSNRKNKPRVPKQLLKPENIVFLEAVYKDLQKIPNIVRRKLVTLINAVNRSKNGHFDPISEAENIREAIELLDRWLQSMRPLENSGDIPELLEEIITNPTLKPSNVIIIDDQQKITDTLQVVWNDLISFDVPSYAYLYKEIYERIQSNRGYKNRDDIKLLNYAVGRLYYASLGQVPDIDWGDL